MNDTFYNNYKTLKEKLDYNYKGYNLKYLVPGYLNFVFDDITPTLREALKSLYHSKQSVDLRQVIQTENPTIITLLINRMDYRRLTDATSSYYKNSVVIDLSSLPIVEFSIFSIHFWIFFIKSTRIVLTRSVGGSLIFKLTIIGILVKIFNQIRLLEKTKPSDQITRYICFNSSYKEESVLSQYFNKRNIETITLQHGIFCNFKKLIPFDYINFENMQTRKVLAWGKATTDFFRHKNKDTSGIITFGNPKYKNIKINKIHQTFKHCLVLLGRGLYIDTNNKLLETLTQYNIQNKNNIIFYIKKHPFLLDEDHKQFANTSQNIIFLGREHSVEDILKSSLVDFSISVNTTAYYESLILGKPCLRWTEAENEEFYGINDKFTSLEEFSEKIETLKTADPNKLLTEVQDVIRYIFNPEL